ncbi:MAG: response regulator RpfG family c-di-GMP phosphodiesterase [Bermanella sp.]|jgi:response regulator RpfG family c-di-GMP phosphodiesterase
MTEATRILFVDDEEKMLTALNRVFRGKAYTVFTADSGQEALKVLEIENIDIIVSDMRMPEMDGATFLAASVTSSPESRRILLTGYSDQESTVRAINEGQVHQYIMKPWDNDQLKKIINGEIVEKNRIQSESPSTEEFEQLQEQVNSVSEELFSAHMFTDMAKEELLKQYDTTIKVISNLINLHTPTSSSMNANVVTHSVALCKLIKLIPKVITEVRNAALLFQIGKIAVDNKLIHLKINEMTKEQLQAYHQHSIRGADLLLPINTLDYTAKLIQLQNENVDGSGFPSGLLGKEIPLGSRVLRIVIDFQQIVNGLYFKDVYSPEDALDFMDRYAGKKYDRIILKLYRKLIDQLTKNEDIQYDKLIKTDDLKPGMTLSRDLVTNEGLLLITKDTKLSSTVINRVKELQEGYFQLLNIFIKDKEKEDPTQKEIASFSKGEGTNSEVTQT